MALQFRRPHHATGGVALAAALALPGCAVAAGLSVNVKDSGRQFASGSDRLNPDAEAMFREIARTYSADRRKAALSPTASADERAAVAFVDFGGVPATEVAASDFGLDGGVHPAGVLAGPTAVPTCSADRPRHANPVKSLASEREIPASDYVPGLYNTSWSDNVNGHLVGQASTYVATFELKSLSAR